MDLSKNGYLEILESEAMCLYPYLDSGGVWTIGVGVTSHDGERITKNTKPLPDVKACITQYKEKMRPYIAAVNKYVTSNVTQQQFDALVSFHYNTGAISKATLTKVVNATPHNNTRIAKEFMKWVNDNGRRVPGLVNRREKEVELYTRGVYHNTMGRALVFPVRPNGRPNYAAGKHIDVSEYFDD